MLASVPGASTSNTPRQPSRFETYYQAFHASMAMYGLLQHLRSAIGPFGNIVHKLEANTAAREALLAGNADELKALLLG